MAEPLICGVDGGGSGCRVAIARTDGTVLARASGDAANHATDPAGAAASVVATVRVALSRIEGAAPRLENLIVHLGIAGVMSAADAAGLARRLPFERCAVTDDRETSVLGALGAADGALVSVGTGSFLAVRRGRALRFAGGWGLHVGDQASGARLGRGLLEQTLLGVDGLAGHSDLTRGILSHFSETPAEIVCFAGQAGPQDYASFAPQIVLAARHGDAVGCALMRQGAAYIDDALAALGRGPGEPVCVIGGLGPEYVPYLPPGLRDRIVAPAGNALDGAVHLARRMFQALAAET